MLESNGPFIKMNHHPDMIASPFGCCNIRMIKTGNEMLTILDAF